VDACAQDLEKATQLFGADVHVRDATLVCTAQKGKDCSSLALRGSVVWAGVDVALEMPCNGGHVEPPATTIAELRPFIESKVVRTIISLTHITPTLRLIRGTWRLDDLGRVDMTLEYDPRAKLIHAHLRNAWRASPLWKALGLLPPLTRPVLTLDGKLVK
jgi:hypothetical protein